MRDADLLSPDDVPRPIPKLGDTYTAQGPCWTAGQARESIALWLAARAVPGAASMLANPPGTEVVQSEGNVDSYDSLFISSFSQHGANFVANGFPSSSVPGVRTAIEMASRIAQARVVDVLSKDWRSWISATTPLDRLRSTLGLSGNLPKARRDLPTTWFPPTCR